MCRLSKHAVDLEKRSIQFSLEEGTLTHPLIPAQTENE
ncbi:hypothetical protein CARUB_v10007244mg [Capsella rubella]|uniref:Uncharacterized protein n=1 Tax=Capsella rubella TaxID=81985 RepID=R0H548_9BRAS|nr:hypothetical protein CARUB_v10007244mg [Capsella rubella]